MKVDLLLRSFHDLSLSIIGPVIQCLIGNHDGSFPLPQECDLCRRSCTSLILVVPNEYSIGPCMHLLSPYVEVWRGRNTLNGEVDVRRTNVVVGICRRNPTLDDEASRYVLALIPSSTTLTLPKVRTVTIACGVEGVQLATATSPFGDEIGILTSSRLHSFTAPAQHKTFGESWKQESLPWSKSYRDSSPLLQQLLICSSVTRKRGASRPSYTCTNPSCAAYPALLACSLDSLTLP